MKGEINVSQLNLSLEEIIRFAMANDQIIADELDRKGRIAHNKEVDRNLEAYKAEQKAAANGRQKNVFDDWAETIGDYADSVNSYDMGTQTNCTAYGNNVTCTTF